MFIWGHGCKYTMMTFIYACTTADMDERIHHEMTKKWHKMNMEQPTWRDTRFEIYLMTITCHLIYWITWCKIWMLWFWIQIVLLCRWPRPQESYGILQEIQWQQDLRLEMFWPPQNTIGEQENFTFDGYWYWASLLTLLEITLIHGDW